MAVDVARLEAATREILIAIGEDPDRDGLQDTPTRYARWWREFIDYEAGNCDTAFDLASEYHDEMIVVRGMKVWSLCEHHLLPFNSVVSIAYIPKDKMMGLSKFARIAHKYAHRLQVQERLVDQIASDIRGLTGSDDVAVIADGEHLCMTMRGIKTPATMRTSVTHGLFRSDPKARNEFLQLVSATLHTAR